MADLKKREKVLMGIAGLIAVFFVIDRFVCGEKVEPPPQVTEKPGVKNLTSNSPGAVKPENKQPKNARKKRTNNESIKFKTWGRDPFAGASRLAKFDSRGTDTSNFILKGVIWKGDQAQVLIGNEILKQGERLGDLEVLAIDKDRVVCKKGGKIVTLVLKEDDILD